MKRDKEKKRIYDKAYHKANLDKGRAWRKAWRERNLEKVRMQNKAFRDANPEYSKLWRKANREKSREAERKHRALKYKTQTTPVNEKIVYLRDGWICQHCKKRVDKRFKHPNPMCASLDHIIPLSQGGTHTYNNVQLAHFGCNRKKFNNILPQGEQLRIF